MRFYNIENFASKKQTIEKFVSQGNNREEVEYIVNTFWTRRNMLKEKGTNDINLYYNDKDGYTKLKSIVNNQLRTHKEKEQERKETKDKKGYVVWENDDYIAWKVESFESAYELGDYNNTCRKWCITMGKGHWEVYRDEKDSTFVFLFKKVFDTEKREYRNFNGKLVEGMFPKNLEDKIAIQIQNETKLTIWDAFDNDYSLDYCSQEIQDIVNELKNKKIINFLTPIENFIEDCKKNITKGKNGNIYNGSLIIADNLITDGTLNFLNEFNIVEVTGDFRCVGCSSLTSLEGSPKNVIWNFYCTNCPSLTSLKGSPQNVGANFYCRDCTSLVSLEGSPQNVGKVFDCSDCTSLVSLDGSPQNVGNNFDCSGCTSLTNLSGCPQNITAIFDCRGCTSLTSLEDSPKNVDKYIICMGCNFDLANFKCDLKFTGEIYCEPEVKQKILECIKQNNMTNFSVKIKKYIK